MTIAVERYDQLADLLAVVLRHVRVQQNRCLVRLGNQALHFLAPRNQLVEFHLEFGSGIAVLDGLDDPVPLFFQLSEFCLVAVDRRVALDPQLVHPPRVFLAEHGAQLGVHQAFLERAQNGLFQLLAPDAQPVIAGAFVIDRGAPEAVMALDGEAAVATAALQQPR